MPRNVACADFRRGRMSRRELLRVGGLGLLGLNLPDLLRLEAAAAAEKPRAAKVKSCILLYYYGGPSHQDTWDMKPDAPAEVRGEFKPIPTKVPGLRVSEHLSRSAQVVDKLAIIRSMHHRMRNHNAAAVEALCGREPLKGDLEFLAGDPTDFPCYGSAVAHLAPGKRPVPPYVALPHVMWNVVKLAGQTAGFLGSAYNPLHVTRDPNDPNFRVGEMSLPDDMTLPELEHRQSILRLLNRQARGWEELAGTGAMDAFYEKAFRLLHSPEASQAFDIAREDPRTRDRYGRNKHGQSVLLARRLVEAGVPFVSVYDGSRNGIDNWDTHGKNFESLKDTLLPPADRALAALIEDLDTRGLLDSTLVVWTGEFGRTPTINKNAGRDHWPDCYSVVLAGGGVEGGSTYGSSDKFAAYPDSNPATPGDLAATIFWRLGLNHTQQIHDFNGRPYRLAEGEPVRALFDGA
jgi:hypothetical protein